jgi:hypothetical protein
MSAAGGKLVYVLQCPHLPKKIPLDNGTALCMLLLTQH